MAATAKHVAGEPDRFKLDTAGPADKPPRALHEIARDIRNTWRTKDGRPNINYAAAPYLDAMSQLDKITDRYICDDAKSIVIYFLGNAQHWRGADAKRIKAELRTLAGIK